MPGETRWRAERARLSEAYARRDATLDGQTMAWSPLRPEVSWLSFVMQQWLWTALRLHGWTPQTIARCRLLDIGCGTGRVLRWCYDTGLRRLVGMDLLGSRVTEAQASAPFAQILQANMGVLPFRDRSFDCVVLYVTFSSCLDDTVRQVAAREIMRVLTDEGCVVWCDFTPGTHEAAYIRGVDRPTIVILFPGTSIRIASFGVRPDWAGRLTSVINQGLLRSVVRRVPRLRGIVWAQRRPITKFPQATVALLEHLPWATSYLGAIIRKRGVRR